MRLDRLSAPWLSATRWPMRSCMASISWAGHRRAAVEQQRLGLPDHLRQGGSVLDCGFSQPQRLLFVGHRDGD